MIVQPRFDTLVSKTLASNAPSILSYAASPFLTAASTTAATTAIGVSSCASVASIVRGGAAAAAALNLTRVKLRLEGLHTYGVMCTLLMNLALRLFSGTPKKMEKNDRMENIVKIVFTVSVALCVSLGGYSSIVMSLLAIYSKRALGLGKEAEFLQFYQAMEPIRHGCYNTFILTLFTFKTSFLLSLFLNSDGEYRWWIAGVVFAFDLYGWYTWHFIYKTAGNLLGL